MAREVDQFHGHKGGIADEGLARLVPILLLVLFSLFFAETVGLGFPPRCLARHASSNENNRHADHSEDGNGDEWSHVRTLSHCHPAGRISVVAWVLQCHGRPSRMCSERLLHALEVEGTEFSAAVGLVCSAEARSRIGVTSQHNE